MVGDVVFFKKNETSFISRIIAKMTKSEYTHVGLIVAFDNLSGEITIIESDRFVNTRINRITLDDTKYVIFTTGDKPKEQVDRIVKFAYRHLGVKYDYLQILGLFLSLLLKGKVDRLFSSKNKLICSELIDLAYYTSSVKRLTDINLGNVTPQELLEVYEFKVRKEV
jgi:Permuted papain-like amidase enzyme, YaeF/YiiX, C92 family